MLLPGVVPRLSNRPMLLPGVVPRLSNRPMLLPGVVPRLSNRPMLLPGVVPRLSSRPMLLPGVVPRLSNRPMLLPGVVNQARFGPSHKAQPATEQDKDVLVPEAEDEMLVEVLGSMQFLSFASAGLSPLSLLPSGWCSAMREPLGLVPSTHSAPELLPASLSAGHRSSSQRTRSFHRLFCPPTECLPTCGRHTSKHSGRRESFVRSR